MIDAPDFYRAFNAPTLLTITVVGLFIGSFIIHRWAVFPSHVLAFLLVAGTAFMVALAVGRIEAPLYWEDAIGELLLWWVFCVAMWVGDWISARKRSPLDRHRDDPPR